MKKTLSMTLLAVAAAGFSLPHLAGAAPQPQTSCSGPTCTAEYVVVPPAGWLVTGTVVQNGQGNEYCEKCAPCKFVINWVFDPPTLARFKVVHNKTASGGGAGGAAGPAVGQFSSEMGCDDFVLLSDADRFEDNLNGPSLFYGIPLCPCFAAPE